MPNLKNASKQLKKAFNRLIAILGIQLISKKKHDIIIRKQKIYDEVLFKAVSTRKASPRSKSEENPLFSFYQYAILEHKCTHNYNILWMTHDGAGIFSCLTTAMWTVLQAVEEGKICHEINNSFSMSAFKNEQGTCTWEQLFKKKSKSEIESIMSVTPISTEVFDHHSDYGTIFKNKLGPTWVKAYLNAYMSPSEAVSEKASFFTKEYKIAELNTIAVCYRGTDKFKEVPPTPLSKYFDTIEELIEKEENWQVLIQTDQKQVCEIFLERYREKCIYIKELPVTTGRIVIHNDQKACGNREIFAENLCAMCLALSKSKYLITHTGNVGLFLALNSLLAGNKVIQLDLDRCNK